jgi:hypothetical protein
MWSLFYPTTYCRLTININNYFIAIFYRDVSGAGAFGFKTIWVNRAGVAWDKLPGKPDLIVKSISEASDFQKGG